MATKSDQNKIFPLYTGYSCTILWVKNSLKSSLSLTVSEIFTIFYFPLKFKMAAKGAKKRNFSFLYRIPLYYPMGKKFTRNRSISYGFRDIYNCLFSAEIQDGHQKWSKLKLFPFAQNTLGTTLWVKNSLKIGLSLMVSEIFTIFYFPLKSKMAARSGKN